MIEPVDPSRPNPSLTLNERDVRRLVRLLADALAPDDGRAPKVNRLMAGLCEWVDADGWFWVRSRINPATHVPENYDFLYGGLTEHHLACWSERSLEVHGRPPENVALSRLMAEGSDFTVSRADIVPDAVWHQAANRDYVRRMGHDAIAFSVRHLGEPGSGLISYVLLLRKTGKPDFTPHDTRLVHSVIRECGPLHVDGLNLSIAADVAALTPRLRTVLALLIDGQNVKQIAGRLSLSVHTVNGYMKLIHRHFGVSSRGELLRRFMTGKP